MNPANWLATPLLLSDKSITSLSVRVTSFSSKLILNSEMKASRLESYVSFENLILSPATNLSQFFWSSSSRDCTKSIISTCVVLTTLFFSASCLRPSSSNSLASVWFSSLHIPSLMKFSLSASNSGVKKDCTDKLSLISFLF